MIKHTLFVYGTLKQHHHNHHLLSTSKYLGTVKTIEKYSLFVSTIPFVSKHPQTSVIHGELYSVDDCTLARLDRLEGHPQWYKREEVDILLDNAQIVAAWLYFNPEPTGDLVSSGKYELR